MAGIKISALPAAASSQLTDIFPAVQSGVTYQETLQQVFDLFQTNGEALTRVNDTNVTVTLGGAPSTALLNAASLTMGWSGQLSLARGGTAANLTAVNGGVVYSGAAALAISAAGSAGQILSSAGAAAPVWTTATFPTTAGAAGNVLISNGTNYVSSTSLWPNTVGSSGTIIRSNGTSNAYSTSTFADTYTASNLLYSNGANTVTGLATANNGMLVTDASGVPSILAGPGTTGNILQSNAAAAPSFSTATYPSVATSSGTILRANGTNWVASTSTFADTYAVSTLLYAGSANAVSGLATANSASLVTNSSGVPAWSSSMTNGQVIIGSTGATPTAAALTAGTGISISNGAGSITINATGGGVATATIAGTSQSAAVNTQYIALNAGQTTVTLPSTYAVGDVVILVGSTANTGGWVLTASAGDTIRVQTSTTSAGGTVTSSAQAGCCIEVICDVADTSWVARSFVSTTLTTA